MAQVKKSRNVETEKAFNIDSAGYAYDKAPCISPTTSPIPMDSGEKASNAQSRASWNSSVPSGKGRGNANT